MHGALPLHRAVVPRVASVLTELPLSPTRRRGVQVFHYHIDPDILLLMARPLRLELPGALITSIRVAMGARIFFCPMTIA